MLPPPGEECLAVLAGVSRVHDVENFLEAHIIERLHVVVPVFHDVAIAQDPALLALKHVVTDRTPVAVIDALLFGVECNTQELVDQVVAFVIKRDALQGELVRPLALVLIILEVAARL